MSERIAAVNGVEICSETFGDPNSPPILLIMGATASMLWWPTGFCRALANGGRYVMRYDSRDTGRSTTYEPGKPTYSLDDLAGDARGVLAVNGVQRAHIAGMSLGGMIGQIVALEHPEAVSSLTLIASSVFGPTGTPLPPIGERIIEYHRSGASVNWAEEKEVVDYMVGGWHLLSGSAHAFDEESIREIATAEVRRAARLPSMFNHALLAGGERWFGRIGEIDVPTLIIHGTEDPVLPYEHGVALSRTIPNATLLTLSGTGHELHGDDWDIMVSAILRHTQEG